MTSIAPDYQTPERMARKRQAVPLPGDLSGKAALDVGCDMAAWSFLCAERGAARVVGIDRNRTVRGAGYVDLLAMNQAVARQRGLTDRCSIDFRFRDLGKQWGEVPGEFDLILCLSMYHHWFENCGDHQPIWFWLWRHCSQAGEVLWEGPVDDNDPVVRANVSEAHRRLYSRETIFDAAGRYFDAEYVGPALHEPTREVWRLKPINRASLYSRATMATMEDGAGGASAAFRHANNRRIEEIARAVGIECVPGSLNLRCAHAFPWDEHYYRAEISDVIERGRGLDGPWSPRWARFYPVKINHEPAFAFRFEGESYDGKFVELIAECYLRECVSAPVMLQC